MPMNIQMYKSFIIKYDLYFFFYILNNFSRFYLPIYNEWWNMQILT